MTTLLFDLDDTLLSNNADTFVETYVKALANHMQPQVDPGVFVSALMASTQDMIANTNPTLSLQEAFNANFFTAIGISSDDATLDINAFYETIYPQLKSITEIRPAAIKLIKASFEKGYSVAITTNPLFPATAIYQRLEWANLSPKDYPYAIITTYENSHFTKPNPAYYAETLAQLGWPLEPIIKIGNDLAMDILPAQQVGLPTYWVTDAKEKAPPTQLAAGQGKLEEITDWIESHTEAELIPRIDSPSAIISIYQSTPAAIDTRLRLLPITYDFLERPSNDEWSIIEIIAHLRDADYDVNLPRLMQLKNETNPFIEAVDVDKLTDSRNYRKQDPISIIQDFFTVRMELIAHLQSLSFKDWQRGVNHSIFGPTSTLELFCFGARHDQNHIRQLWRVLESQQK